MSRASSFHKSAPFVLASLFVLLTAVAPSFAAAQTSAIQTQELLPPGQNACQAITVTDLEPHVYGGVLESFDVTISDTSDGYVGVLATAGDSPIPLSFITRWAGTPSGLRVHVDTPDISVEGGLPIDLTLLSSLPNQPTCITVISFEVTGVGITAASAPAPTPVSMSQGSAPVSNEGNPTPVMTNTSPGSVNTMPGNSSNMTNTSSTAALGAGVAAASNAQALSNICTGGNAYRLWFLLLALYIVIVALVVFAEPWFLSDSVLASTSAILVPLILLLAFWYFSSSCRAASWIPVAACVIAIIGLFLAFREYETPPLLPASTTST